MKATKGVKRILIYGDSLTWGRIPGSTERYDEDTRYTCILQKELGNDFEVVKEGLRGRMVLGENVQLPHRDGFDSFPGIYLNRAPLDLVAIFLGINDTQKAVNKTPKQIVQELKGYIKAIEELSKATSASLPKVLFVAPPTVQKKYLNSGTKFEGSEKKSEELVRLIKQMVMENKVLFFDSNKYIETSEEDGVHLTAEKNITLGKELAKFIREH